MSPEEEACRQRRRKAHHLCDQLGLDRDDRIALAETLLWRDVRSWSDLDDPEIRRLLDSLEGHILISQLLLQRNSPWTGQPA